VANHWILANSATKCFTALPVPANTHDPPVVIQPVSDGGHRRSAAGAVGDDSRQGNGVCDVWHISSLTTYRWGRLQIQLDR